MNLNFPFSVSDFKLFPEQRENRLKNFRMQSLELDSEESALHTAEFRFQERIK